MAGVEINDFSAPDEVRRPEHTTVEVVKLAGGEIGRYTFQPGWRWSEHIKPVVGTDSCQTEHIGYVVSGNDARRERRRHQRRRHRRAASTGSRPDTTPGSSATNRSSWSSSRARRPATKR